MAHLIRTEGRAVVVRHLVRRPTLWTGSAGTLATLCFITSVAVALIATLSAIALVFVAAHQRRIRARIERSARKAAWNRRCHERESRLEDADIPAFGLQDATRLLAEIDAHDPQLSAHLDLEPLLTRYVELELYAKRCTQSLQQLRTRSSEGASGTHDTLRERISDHRVAIDARIRLCHDEIAAIPELFEMIILQRALDTSVPDDEHIDECLALLASEDELMRGP